MPLIDMTGMTLGRFTVLDRAANDYSRRAMWRCRCSCGNEVIVQGHDLRAGRLISCGCYIRTKRDDDVQPRITSVRPGPLVCKKCGEEKPHDGFKKNRTAQGGRALVCRSCNAARRRELRQKNLEYEYARDNARHLERWKDKWEQTREYELERKRKLRAAGDLHMKARDALKAAVRSGRISKPAACSSCGATTARIDGHHEDYSRPLDVVWLCSGCHGRIHRKAALSGEGAIA